MLKKIETKEHKHKREAKKTIIGLIIGFIMVASTIAFTLTQNYESQEKKVYKEFSFTNQEGLWLTKIGETTIQTIYFPSEVENVTPTNPSLNLRDFSGKAVYIIAKNELEKQAAYELTKYVSPLRIQSACSPGDNDIYCNELPEKSCEAISTDEAIITIKDTSQSNNETSINYKTDCLEIQGNEQTLMKVTDKSIFLSFGIIA